MVLREEHVVKSVGFLAARCQGGQNIVQVLPSSSTNHTDRQFSLVLAKSARGSAGISPLPSQSYFSASPSGTDESGAAQASRRKALQIFQEVEDVGPQQPVVFALRTQPARRNERGSPKLERPATARPG